MRGFDLGNLCISDFSSVEEFKSSEVRDQDILKITKQNISILINKITNISSTSYENLFVYL